MGGVAGERSAVALRGRRPDARMGAVSLQRSRTALEAAFRCTAHRMDDSIAVSATAHKLAVLVYHILRYGGDHADLGEKAFEKRIRRQRITGLSAPARSLGFRLVRQGPTAA